MCIYKNISSKTINIKAVPIYLCIFVQYIHKINTNTLIMINHDYVRIRNSNFRRISHGIFHHIGRETSYLVFFATAMAMCLDPKLPFIWAQKEGGKVDERAFTFSRMVTLVCWKVYIYIHMYIIFVFYEFIYICILYVYVFWIHRNFCSMNICDTITVVISIIFVFFSGNFFWGDGMDSLALVFLLQALPSVHRAGGRRIDAGGVSDSKDNCICTVTRMYIYGCVDVHALTIIYMYSWCSSLYNGVYWCIHSLTMDILTYWLRLKAQGSRSQPSPSLRQKDNRCHGCRW